MTCVIIGSISLRDDARRLARDWAEHLEKLFLDTFDMYRVLSNGPNRDSFRARWPSRDRFAHFMVWHGIQEHTPQFLSDGPDGDGVRASQTVNRDRFAHFMVRTGMQE